MRKSTLLVLFGLLVASTADAADWGDLKVKFTFDGDAQKAAAITVNKDPEFCGKFKLVDERLVVNPKNKGIKNIVVFLYTRGSTKVPVHADYAKEADAEIVLNNADCRYEPHVICARIGQKFKVGNPDSVAHNSKIDFFSNTPANPIIPPMKSVDGSRQLLDSPLDGSLGRGQEAPLHGRHGRERRIDDQECSRRRLGFPILAREGWLPARSRRQGQEDDLEARPR